MDKHKIPILPKSIRNGLRGAQDPYWYFSKVRRESSSNLYPALAAWIPNLAQKRPFLVEGRFPPTLRALRRETRILLPLGFANEIMWSAVVLRGHSKRLADFRTASKRFENNLLSGDYDGANSDLNEIDHAFGYSLWSIEARLALLQSWKGLEAQKAFASEIKESEGSDFVGFFAYVISQRNEETTNPHRFKSSYSEASVSWQLSDEFKEYILFRIASHIPNSPRTMSAVLRVESVS